MKTADPPSLAELKAANRARLFAQCALLERSGISLLDGLSIIRKQSPAEFANRFDPALTAIQRGNALATAGRSSGLLLPWEAKLIGAAETAGELGTAFRHLQSHYEAKATRSRKFKSRMVYPLTVCVLALLIVPLPGLVRGDIDGSGYLARSVLPLIVLYLSIRLLNLAYKRLQAGERATLIGGLLLTVAPLRRQHEFNLLAIFGALLKAGIPALQAFWLVADSTADKSMKQRLQGAHRAVEQGASVAQGLQAAGLLDDEGGALVSSGEFAGRLDESLAYYSDRLNQTSNGQLDTWAEWLPRLFYALVVVALLKAWL